jgi:tetratricopeptide (TPR) repeat protein
MYKHKLCRSKILPGALWGIALGLSLPGQPVRAQLEPGSEALIASYDSEAAGKLREALGALEQLPPGRKDSYLGWARRGWLLYRLGQHADSVESYKKAIAHAPRAVEPRLGILLPQLALHRWTDAELMAKEVLRMDPASYLATLRLAFAYYNLQRYPESAALYQKLRDLYPSDTDVRSGLSWALLKAGRNQEAAREFRDLLAISPRLVTAQEGLKLTGVR